MKKTAIILTLLMLGLVSRAGERSGPTWKPAYVPKHEFCIQGALSSNTIFLKKAGDEELERVKGDEYNLKFSKFFPAGFEYTYHFDSHWGITTGFGLSHHPLFEVGSTGTHTVVNTGTFPLREGSDPKIYREYTFTDEYHSMVLDYITIPVLGKYMHPIGKGFQLYAQAGFRLGFLLCGEEELATSAHSYSFVEMTIKGNYFGEDRYDYSAEAERCSITNELQLYHSRHIGGGDIGDDTNYFRNFNLYSSLEAGIRIPVYGSFGLYAGGFIDVGMIRPFSRRAHIFPIMEDGKRTSVPALETWCTREDVKVTHEGDIYTVTADTKPFYSSIIPFSAGFKMKVAF